MGFDIDHKHTLACLVQAGRLDRYASLRMDVSKLREWLQSRSPLAWALPTNLLTTHFVDGVGRAYPTEQNMILRAAQGAAGFNPRASIPCKNAALREPPRKLKFSAH